MTDAFDPARCFAAPDGAFRFARWGRAPAPVVFGAEDATIAVFRAALTAVFDLAGRPLAETDPELGANLMIFCLRDWAELAEIPGLDRLIPELPALLPRLSAGGAHQYRLFRFDAAGAIRAAFVFLRIEGALADLPVAALALGEAVQVALLWSEGAFAATPPLVRLAGGAVAMHPGVAALIRAAYDPVLPDAGRDPALALRLQARLPR